MPTKQIIGLGKAGIIKDIPAVLLPENAFTDGRNIRFDNESVETITGEAIYQTPTIHAEYGIHYQNPATGTRYNIYCVNDGLIRVDATGAVSSTINFTGTHTDSRWQLDYFNGGYTIIFNDGETTPLYYDTTSITFEPQLFPGWNYSGTTVVAKVIKQLGYSLVAANFKVTLGGTTTYAPSTIRISTQAPAGGFPQVWEPGTTTDTADEFEINSTSPILDMGELRGNMYIYSSDSIHVLTTNTGTTRVQPYAKGYGILNQGCFAEFDGKHLVVDRNDIYIHAGSGSIESVANTRMRDYFFDNLNKSASDNVTVRRNAKNDEIWICYPKGSNTTCNEALIYQYRNNTWTIRDLPNIISIFKSYSISSNSFVEADERLIMLDGSLKSFITDEGYQMWNGSALADYTSYLSREKLNSGDTLGSMYINSITPIFDEVPNDAAINITVTGQNNYIASADWSNTSGRDLFEFLPNNTSNQGYKVDPRTTGRLLNYKVSSTDYWRLALIGIDVAPADRR
jgi:hypothetical protein